MEKVFCRPFSNTATTNPPFQLAAASAPKWLREKYIRGCVFGLDNLKQSGVFRLAGWSYDFRPYLKRFVVKQYGRWSEEYAPNKTAIRKSTHGTIEEIVEMR